MAIILPKSVFFHIQKTGGNWVEEAVKQAGLKREFYNLETDHPLFLSKWHIGPDQADKRIKGKFKFAFVRNPLSWYQSFWAFRMNRNYTGWNNSFILDKVCTSGDFNEAVNKWVDKLGGFVSDLYKEFLGNDLEKVDYVGKQESLEDDLVIALRLAGEIFDEDKLRNTKARNIASKKPEYDKLIRYNIDTVNKVVKAEKWAMNKFAYKWDIKLMEN